MKIRIKRASRSRSGFSLLEVMIAAAIMAGMITAVTMTSLSASKTYDTGQTRADLDRQAHRTLDLLTEQLLTAGRAGLTPSPNMPFGSSTLDYRRAEGFAGGAVVWGLTNRLALQLEQGELNDGLDNNSNGFVDEQVIVWTEDPGQPTQRQTIWSHNVSEFLQGELPNAVDDNGNGLVDEGGLSFLIQGEVLTIRLTLQRLDPTGRVLTKTVQTSVRIRN